MADRDRVCTFVPATPAGLHPAVVPALLAAGLWCRVTPMRADTDYCRELARVWAACQLVAQQLLIVEHDVEVTRPVVDGLLDCPLPWCVAPYNSHEALGCTKFEPARLGSWPLSEHVPWLALDHGLYRALMDGAGVGPHVHAHPRPTHHHYDVHAGAVSP